MIDPDRYKPGPCIVVIFGASGDLARRKLGPALYELEREGLLPDATAVVGTGRSPLTDEQFRDRLRGGVESFSRSRPLDRQGWASFAPRLFYQQAEYGNLEDTRALGARLEALDARFGTDGSRIFYLALPPHLVVPVLDSLTRAGMLARRRSCDGDACFLRVVFEKPFGHDLESARQLNNAIDGILDEPQVYRMDHYLGKETVQNISVLRFANSIFEHIWHSQSISSLRVTVAETIGVEGRGGYFDRTGILRDILQNHVLQLLTLVTMEPPASLDADAIRDEKVKVLRCLRPFDPANVRRSVVRGQYACGVINGAEVPGYREEEGVNPASTTETFVALRTYIDNWRWAGVPVYLCAGKRLARSLAEVAIEFKPVPAVLFGALRDSTIKPNRLKIRVQPDEGVSLRFTSKVPGLGMELRDVLMDFPYGSAFPAASPEAYERLLLDVMAGNSALFARRDEVELAWTFATSILGVWEAEGPPDFPNYRPGTWGPAASEDFFNPRTDYSRVTPGL